MTLFMTLLVRDEEDVLEANMRFHLESGVDHIIVTDNLSTDACPQIVEEFVAQGSATLIRENEDVFAQSRWVSRMADMAADAGARWVMHSDADEFWVAPRGQSLNRYFRRVVVSNVVRAKRHDFVALEDDGRPFWQRMTFRRTSSFTALGKPLPPKIAHRARPGVAVGSGNHSVRGIPLQRRLPGRLEVLHFPIRSRAQRIRKIENGGRALDNDPQRSKNFSPAWRQQYIELCETGTISYVDQSFPTGDELCRMLDVGEVVKDTRIRDALESSSRA